MKKLTALIIALAVFMCIPAMAETEKVSLTFVRIGNDEAERAYWQWVIEGFEKEYPNIHIEYDEKAIGDAMDSALNTKFASGDGVDIMGHGIL